jgi:putative transposase
MRELVRRRPRYGYRRIWALLRREGWKVNKKCIHLLWRREGVRVPVQGPGKWLERASVGTLYVEPGAPWENGYA